jgi:chloramphenicol 3-O phosphotransferase
MLLNGSPSAGKTSLAQAIQRVALRPLFHRSLDDFLAGYPPERRRDDSTLFDKVLSGYLHSLAALARAGCDVVAEAVIIPERKALYDAAFTGVPTILVGVRCGLETAQRREAERTDRTPLDLDVPWFVTVHEVEYDAEVDTSDDPPLDEIAAQLAALFD